METQVEKYCRVLLKINLASLNRNPEEIRDNQQDFRQACMIFLILTNYFLLSITTTYFPFKLFSFKYGYY